MKRVIVMALLCVYVNAKGISQPITENKAFPIQLLPKSLKEKWVPGKPALIEVFSSFCSSSFTVLPELKKIDELFHSRLQLFLIGKQDSNIAETYRQYAELYNLSFPVAIDSSFFRNITTGYLPTFIWVNKRGMVKALTGDNQVTHSNIELLLNDQPIYVEKYLPARQLTGFLEDVQRDSNLMIRSELTRWNKSDPILAPISINKQASHFQALGITHRQMYYYAFAGKRYWSVDDSLYGTLSKAIVFDAGDDAGIGVDSGARYNYRLAVNKTIGVNDFMGALREDLDRSMPYTAALEYRLMPYWRLTAIGGDTTRLATKSIEAVGQVSHSSINVKNHPLKVIIQLLDHYFPYGEPILDETGIKGNIDLSMAAVLSDREDLRKGLEKAGIVMEKGEKLMKVIVLKPKMGSVATKRAAATPPTN